MCELATRYLENKQKLRGIRYMLLAIAVINAVVTLGFAMTASFMENPVSAYIQTLVTGLAAYVIPIFIYARINRLNAETASERFYLKKCEIKYIVLAAVMGACWQFVMVVINLPINLIFKTSAEYSFSGIGELAAAMAVIGIIPAVFEEFLFRGIVYGSMSEFNTRAAMVFSAAMFAILHADMYEFLGYAAMGIVLTAVVGRTRSVYTAMTFHFTNNAVALLLGYFNSELVYSPVLTISLFTAGTIGFVILFAGFTAVTTKPGKVRKIKTSQLLGQSFVNIPIPVCIAVVIAAAVLVRIM